MFRFIPSIQQKFSANYSEQPNLDNELEEVDFNIVRYRPESLDTLCEITKFSRKELQIMYRGFKQGCPSGIVNVDQFKEIYAQFFPQGDSGKYAQLIFNTFDKDQNGTISFEVSFNFIFVHFQLHFCTQNFTSLNFFCFFVFLFISLFNSNPN